MFPSYLPVSPGISNMSKADYQSFLAKAERIPPPLLAIARGVGQVFFQENALTGVLFVIGIAIGSPLMALGALAGSAIGTATAWVGKFDKGEFLGGIYGFNGALVGIATLFFFKPGGASIGLLVAGSVVATLITWVFRRYVPFPTYTTPFIVTTWAIFFLGAALGASRVAAGGALESPGYVQAIAHGVSQVMFQASLGTAFFFLLGIALSDWRHASWVLLGSVVGMMIGNYHLTEVARALDPESLIDRSVAENVALGLYGYNATLAAVALYLWRRSFIPPILGMFLAVGLTDLVPLLGLPALTAPFVLATWMVLALGWLDGRFLKEPAASTSS